MQNYFIWGLSAAVICPCIILCLRFLRGSLGFLVHTALKAVWGTALLMAFNTLSRGGGIFLAVNPVTIGVCGILGIPGTLALAFIRLWL